MEIENTCVHCDTPLVKDFNWLSTYYNKNAKVCKSCVRIASNKSRVFNGKKPVEEKPRNKFMQYSFSTMEKLTDKENNDRRDKMVFHLKEVLANL